MRESSESKFFFFNDTATTEIYTLSLHDALPILQVNHPRSTGFGEFQAAFTRANLKYDFTAHTIYGDFENADVPNDYLRLPDRKSTRLNSSHLVISYADFCFKKKTDRISSSSCCG